MTNLPTCDGISKRIAETIELVEATEMPDPLTSEVSEPGSLALSQFYDLHHGNHPDGQTRLMFAILDDAVRCYVKNATATRGLESKLFAEAEAWFCSDCLPQSRFSFGQICEELGIRREIVRARLNTLTVADLWPKHRGVMRVMKNGRQIPGLSPRAGSFRRGRGAASVIQPGSPEP